MLGEEGVKNTRKTYEGLLETYESAQGGGGGGGGGGGSVKNGHI